MSPAGKLVHFSLLTTPVNILSERERVRERIVLKMFNLSYSGVVLFH